MKTFDFMFCRQIYKNCRNPAGLEGLSLLFVIQWLLGDSTNLVGCILTEQLPVQVRQPILNKQLIPASPYHNTREVINVCPLTVIGIILISNFCFLLIKIKGRFNQKIFSLGVERMA